MIDIAHPLYFVRHGQTDWNALARYQGSTDTSLSELGKHEAQRNGKLLAARLQADQVELSQLQLVSSPLKRARQTSEIISSCFDPHPPVTINPVFRELSAGRWEGLTSIQVKERYYEERKSRKLDRWLFKPQGGESMAERSDEIENGLRELSPNSVLITHCVVLRIIFHLLTDFGKQAATSVETPHVSIWCWNGVKLHRQD